MLSEPLAEHYRENKGKIKTGKKIDAVSKQCYDMAECFGKSQKRLNRKEVST